MIEYRPHVAASTRIPAQIGTNRHRPRATFHTKPNFDAVAYAAAREVLG